MKIITKKTLLTIVITNLLLTGMSACTSSPAPWAEAGNSPWSEKHEAEKAGMPAEKVDTESLKDPVLLADSEPATEPVVLDQPEAAPVPKVIAEPVVAEKTPEQMVLAMPPTNYAVQVYASKTIAGMDKFKTDKDLDGLMTLRTNRKGNIIYVLVDIHLDRASAKQAATYLEKKTGSKPWIRSVLSLQKIISNE